MSLVYSGAITIRRLSLAYGSKERSVHLWEQKFWQSLRGCWVGL